MFRFRSGSTGNTHALLNDVDCFNYVSVGTDIVLNAGNRLCISKQPFHFGLGAAVAEFQVIKHRVILLGKALVCVLDESDVRTHLIGVIRHVSDRHVRILDCRLRITAQRGNQRCGEGCDRGHIVIGRHTRSFICVIGVLLQGCGGVFEQGVDTTDKLFILTVGFHHSFAQGHSGGCGSSYHRAHRNAHRFQSAAQLGEFPLGVIGGISGIIQFLFQIIGAVSNIVHFMLGIIQSRIVTVEFPLHVVQRSGGIIKLNLPLLCPAVILTERLGGIGKCLAQGLDFLLLGFDFLVQHLVPGSEGFHGIVVFVELRLNDLHFRAEDFEGLVDFRQSLLEFLFALKTDF